MDLECGTVIHVRAPLGFVMATVQDSWGIATFATPELARVALRKDIIWCDRRRATLRRHRGVCIMNV